MTSKEVLEALIAGKKLRRTCWTTVKYIHLVGEELEDDKGIPFGELYLDCDNGIIDILSHEGHIHEEAMTRYAS